MPEWKVPCKTRWGRGKVLRLAEDGGELAVRRVMQELAWHLCKERDGLLGRVITA